MKKLVSAAVTALLLGVIAPVVSQAAAGRAAPASAPAPTRRVSAALATTLASGSSAPVQVLVQATSRDAGIAAVRQAGLHLDDVLDAVEVAVATGSPSSVRALSRDGRVTYVEQVTALSLLADDTADIATRTAEARAAGSPVLKQGTTPYTGAGESIAIVDTGVDGTHPMFTDPKTKVSKVVVNMKLACTNDGSGYVFPDTCPTDAGVDPFFVDFSPVNDTDTPSIGGHGTHVAGIAAGYPVKTADGRTLMGTAPGAKIVSLSIGETLTTYGADAALDWILRHHADPCGDRSCPPITVVNNSYGGGDTFDPQSTTTRLQDSLVKAGVVMVWANGNGDTTNNGGDGSTNMSSADAMDPIRGSISVANYDDGGTGTRDGVIDPSSSRGDKTRPETWPDLSAPGTDITSACRPNLTICRGTSDTDPNFGTISGTSMATPHVAGIVALVREAQPSLTPAQVQDVLENTAYKLQSGAPYWLTPRTGNRASSSSYDKGHGLIDTTAALASILQRKVGAAAACSGNDPHIVDPAGDATSLDGVTTPLPSEPSLDLRAGGVSWSDAQHAMTFTIRVEDLAATNPPGTTGVFFDFAFEYNRTSYVLRSSRSDIDGDTADLQVLGDTGRESVAPATVRFDTKANTITVTLRNADLAKTTGAAAVKPFATGDVLSGFAITSRREEAVLVPDADTAHGTCTYRVGGAAVAAPIPAPRPFPTSPQSPPAGSTTLTDGKKVTPTFTTTHDTTGVPVVDGHTCSGMDDPLCFRYVVTVRPGAKSTLSVSLDAGIPADLRDDWDFTIYDASGKDVGESSVPAVVYPASAGPQTVFEQLGATVPVSAPATYTIVVQPFNVPKGAKATLTVSLDAG